MNYCTKCESYYQEPGTCNCFASAQQQPVVLRYPYTPPPSTFYPVWPQDTTYRPTPYTYPYTTCSSSVDTCSDTVQITGTQMAEDLRTGMATLTEAN